MLTLRLVLGITLSLVGAGLAAWIGRQFLAAGAPGDAGRATRRFGVWWVFLAIDATINQATWLLGGLDLDAPWAVAVLTYAAVIAISVMLWGLASYILYLFTGSSRVFPGVTLFYGAQGSAMLALVVFLGPNGVTSTAWGGQVAYATPPPGWAALAVAAFFLLPPILAAIALATLIPRTKDGATRRRIAALSAGIFAWFGGALILGAIGRDAGPLVGFALSIGCMLAIARAYAPQRPHALAPARARDSELTRRVNELV